MAKTLIGPQLRSLRQAHNQTQSDMARKLGVSSAYVNLLENNQRSVSVKVLMALSEAYGIDARDLVKDSPASQLSELRARVRDPIFSGDEPDLVELRAALDHTPKLVSFFLQLHENHHSVLETIRKFSAGDVPEDVQDLRPESAIHNFFRDHSNHFPVLEDAAEAARAAVGGPPEDLFFSLKRYLKHAFGIDVVVADVDVMDQTLREFDRLQGRVMLSEALDPVNRNFQLAHVLAFVSSGEALNDLVEGAKITTDQGRERCRVELANYFAAAFLMPYDAIYQMAETTRYDIDRIATHFGVSFEQVSHRLTTLQRKGAKGVPFFFLRIDTAGNVTKRFNATSFALAEQGGACPVWAIHSAFANPDVIVPQFVEMPDNGQFFTVSRTTNRPVVSRHSQARRLVVTLGCAREHVRRIGYAAPFNLDDLTDIAKIGINCHICPRRDCSQRAYEPLHVRLPLDANRRGSTRYQS
ncbi:short-chain fatty acyl-CoA regulator family protein [Nereida sp. MMG025]|uniref:helix-turn-helix domain-containing protein n=1 Tax=Nereida sp. MMG025 TaxID=2909981 RepID=UPI001F3D5C8C|nr:helix-turn-helix transcriptional regulator [Nereida sp. MMG025]MCF6445065.1 short-chain fatty acyl-CoA regulator family protein [Nereida sp. MMG025]